MPTDPRTDRRQLTTVAYGSGRLLADRAQLYRFVDPPQEPMPEWLFGLVGGSQALAQPIIDVGAGNGQYLLALTGRSAVGVDLSPGMLQGIVSAGFTGPLLVADTQCLPLRTASAGTALANHMLYHVPDIALAARELRRVLHSGGCLLAVTNAADHLAEIRTVMDASITELAGAEFHLDTSGARFRLEDGAVVLGEVFASVAVHHRRARMVVPEWEPVLRYMASMVGLAPSLPAGLNFEDVLECAGRRVRQTVASEGVFRITVHAGAFVCH